MKLRPYQQEAVNAIFSSWQENQRTLLVLPTGCGKTIVFASVVDRIVKGLPGLSRVLILAHRDELLDQAQNKLQLVTGIVAAREKGKFTITSNELVDISSWQTMDRRLKRFKPNCFDYIIVDEAHHIMSKGYQRIVNHFRSAKVLGVTATPERMDNLDLMDYFDDLAYQYTIRQAMEEGYLSRARVQTCPINIDIRQVHTKMGDYDTNEVADAIQPYFARIIAEMNKYADKRKIVVFLPLVRISQEFCAMCNHVGFRAAEINGNSKDRKEILAAFEAGEYDVLCNSMLLTEGWDCPSVDCVVILRPTKSRGLYQQMVGRGLRLAPNKHNCLILDFLWLERKHSLCRPYDLLGVSEDVAEKMDDAIKQGAELDLMDAEEQAKKDVQAEREAAIQRKLEQTKHREAQSYDPLTGQPTNRPTQDNTPTVKQRYALSALGFRNIDQWTKQDAWQIMRLWHSKWVDKNPDRLAMALHCNPAEYIPESMG